MDYDNKYARDDATSDVTVSTTSSVGPVSTSLSCSKTMRTMFSSGLGVFVYCVCCFFSF